MAGGLFLSRAIRAQILPAIWFLTASLNPSPKSIALAAPYETKNIDTPDRCQNHVPFEGGADQTVIGTTELQYSDACPLRESSDFLLIPYNPDITRKLASEHIEPKYSNRYQKWKAELLKTKFGRTLWSRYWNNQQFTLFIKIGPNSGGEHGASTTGYHWDEKGHLNAATIILGQKVDSDYPTDDKRYPILASLRPRNGEFALSPETVAAAKIAHEFGHIEVVAAGSQRSYCLRNFLVAVWNGVFSVSGRASQPEIERLMGGTPPELGARGEVQAETAGTLRFLTDRFPGKPGAPMPRRIRRVLRTFVTCHDRHSASTCPVE